jgi:heme-degrading monooxygenase HmoA
MEKGTLQYVITTQCPSQDEAKFHKWYNEVHIPMLLKFKRLRGASRYQVVPEGKAPRQYIAVYEFASRKDFEDFGNSPELAAAIKEMQSTWGDKVKITSMAQWEFLKNWQR